ncbi:hypothetical protein SDC9_92182 [bioreactor metagenome]|uniref:Uncharacterized protein n=1 Tax=bioreactor metagenome TaxID=1076179 RepID=A0A644ZX46_9ZZZZ
MEKSYTNAKSRFLFLDRVIRKDGSVFLYKRHYEIYNGKAMMERGCNHGRGHTFNTNDESGRVSIEVGSKDPGASLASFTKTN